MVIKQKEKKTKRKAKNVATNHGSREKAASFFLQWQVQNADSIAAYNTAMAEANLGKANASNAKARAIRLNALPRWADPEAIERIYAEGARHGMHVDHIIPLKGKTVCGLHVENNLTLLSSADNLRKGNRFE